MKFPAIFILPFHKTLSTTPASCPECVRPPDQSPVIVGNCRLILHPMFPVLQSYPCSFVKAKGATRVFQRLPQEKPKLAIGSARPYHLRSGLLPSQYCLVAFPLRQCLSPDARSCFPWRGCRFGRLVEHRCHSSLCCHCSQGSASSSAECSLGEDVASQ